MSATNPDVLRRFEIAHADMGAFAEREDRFAYWLDERGYVESREFLPEQLDGAPHLTMADGKGFTRGFSIGDWRYDGASAFADPELSGHYPDEFNEFCDYFALDFATPGARDLPHAHEGAWEVPFGWYSSFTELSWEEWQGRKRF